MLRRFCFSLAAAVSLIVQAEDFGWVGTNSLAMPAVGEHCLRILSPTVLQLSLITTKKPEAPPAEWNFVGDNFSLELPANQQFTVAINGASTSVKRTGFKRRPLYAPLKVRDLRILNELYLELASPAAEGARVRVQFQGKTYEAVADALRFNPALHVNEAGYQTDFPKRAMAGYYLGSMGELRVPASRFALVDAVSGAEVFSGAMRPRLDRGFTGDPPPYQSVLEANFSSFKTPGVYRLKVEGMGASFPFRIDEGSAALFARTYMLGLYHQRCGTSNSLPFTRFTHDACHTGPVEIPTLAFKNAQAIIADTTSDSKSDPRHSAPQLKNTEASLYPFMRHGTIDLRGGHHDAGDYSRYTINSAGLIHALVFAVDSFAGVSGLDNLGIPESGDGKSDLLQEAKWEADFLAKMQDEDGGFYFLVYPKERRYEDNVLPDRGDPQIVWPKNTSATAAAVAALAEIGSSPVCRKEFPEASRRYLNAAQRGWDFLQRALAKYGSDGAYQKLTHYGHEFLHDDELAWAAAALFSATGRKEFEKALISGFNPEARETRRWSWWPLFEGYGNAVRTYVFSVRNGKVPVKDVNGPFLTRCESLLHETAMNHVRFARESAYGTSFPDPNKANRNAGWYFSTERAFDIMAAWQLRHDPAYLDAVVSNLNYEAGCNPLNVAFITGLGWRRQREIVHQYAQNDRRVLPPTGLPLGNIQAGFAYLHHYKAELGALCYPPDGSPARPYPFYDRWGDSFNTTTEFVVVDAARSLATTAALMALTPVKTQHWQFAEARIRGVPGSAQVNQTVQVSLQVEGLSLTNARVTWEARDQEPVITDVFSFKPKNVGEQWIEAEAVWPDGRRASAKAAFSAAASADTPANAYASAPLKPTADTLALYHLDRRLSDETGHCPDLRLIGRVPFDTANVSWMKERQGATLRFHDIGESAVTQIDPAKLAGKTEIELQAMIYINALKAYNRTNAHILSLREDWNSQIELIENIYEGLMIKGGTQFSIPKAKLEQILAPAQWHHIAITVGGDGYRARIDGQEVAHLASGEIQNWGRKPATLEIGNFDGYIDELAVICKSKGN